MSAAARALRKTTSPFSSHRMTPWGRVSRARRRRMASALASVTASAAAPVTCSRWLSTGSTAALVGRVDPEPVGQGGQPLLEGPAAGPPADRATRPRRPPARRRTSARADDGTRSRTGSPPSMAGRGAPAGRRIVEPEND